MRKPPFACARQLFLSCLALFPLVSGCADADAKEAMVSEPPYRVDPDADARLFVRDDLANRLKTLSAKESDEAARITGFGRVGFAPDASYAVRVPFPSHVERVLVAAGDNVKAGQSLVELRSRDLARLRAEISRARVETRLSAQIVERLRPLVPDGTATPRELREAEASLEVAQSELASLQQSLAALGIQAGRGDRYVLRASADGSVIRRNIAVGERISEEDDPAFVIGNPDRLVVHAAFPERDLRWLSEGASCFFTVHALLGETFEGVVTRVLRAVDPKTRSAEAICAPKQQEHAFTAEMVARVEVEARGKNRLLLPRKALLMKRDEWVAFVRIDENVVERRHVRPGLSLGDLVEIVEGIAVGEEVVIEGAVLLDGELDVLL